MILAASMVSFLSYPNIFFIIIESLEIFNTVLVDMRIAEDN